MNSFLTWWRKLTPMQQLVLFLIFLVIVWYIAQRFIALKEATTTSIKRKAEIDVLLDSGKKPSYSEARYKQMADDLYEAMDGPGTDDEVVLSIFRSLKNDIDFIKLFGAFGVQEASDDLFGYYDAEDLRGWLKDDLSEDLIKSINASLRNQGLTKQI